MIEQLVKDLPEVYQPIFGHKGLSYESSRLCIDRLIEIEQIYSSFEQHLGRHLKVLDLGCAQGFFSLSLARRGAVVHGVDYLDKNIALCNALALENPSLQVKFTEGKIEEIVDTINQNQYDLVLGLSVFHHLVYLHGVPFVKELLTKLAKLNGALLLELALQNEPLYWGPSQPSNPRELIQEIGFVHLLSFHETHLAEIPRPLYVASDYYWFLDGFIGEFDSWTFDSHAYANNTHQFSRRYYSNEDYIVKMFMLEHPRGLFNKNELLNEITLLKECAAEMELPALITYGQNSNEIWNVMERIRGRSLLDLIIENAEFNRANVLLDVLKQLAALESSGLYHNDIRVWNVLVDENNKSVRLIDFGAISTIENDCQWPSNVFLSFFIFVNEVLTSHVNQGGLFRTVAISPFSLPEPYDRWARSIWELPVSNWSFKLFYEKMQKLESSFESDIEEQAINLWMRAIEDAFQIQNSQNINFSENFQSIGLHNESKLQQIENRLLQSETKVQQAETKAEQAEAKAEQAESKAQQAEIYAQEAESRARQAEINAQEMLQVQVQLTQTQVQQVQTQVQQAQMQVQLAQAQIQQMHVEAQQLELSAQQARAASNQHLNQLQAVYASSSWRITRPMRAIKRVLSGDITVLKLVNAKVKLRSKQMAKPVLLKAISYANSKPVIKNQLRKLVSYFPWLEQRLLRIVINSSRNIQANAEEQQPIPWEYHNMPPRTRQIYHDLKTSIENSNNRRA